MSRHIDDTQMLPAGKIKGGESEFNGNAPFFFLLSSIGIRAGQRLNQAGLAMIDMSGGSQDNLFQ